MINTLSRPVGGPRNSALTCNFDHDGNDVTRLAVADQRATIPAGQPLGGGAASARRRQCSGVGSGLCSATLDQMLAEGSDSDHAHRGESNDCQQQHNGLPTIT